MANTIKIKRSSVGGVKPSSLQEGELGINLVDGIIFYGDGASVSSIIAESADKLSTARTITLDGDVTGSADFDGSSNITINTTSLSTGLSASADETITGSWTFDNHVKVSDGSYLLVDKIDSNPAGDDVILRDRYFFGQNQLRMTRPLNMAGSSIMSTGNIDRPSAYNGDKPSIGKSYEFGEIHGDTFHGDGSGLTGVLTIGAGGNVLQNDSDWSIGITGRTNNPTVRFYDSSNDVIISHNVRISNLAIQGGLYSGSSVNSGTLIWNAYTSDYDGTSGGVLRMSGFGFVNELNVNKPFITSRNDLIFNVDSNGISAGNFIVKGNGSEVFKVSNVGDVTAQSFSGDGSLLSNIDADTLDGKDSTDFALSSQVLTDVPAGAVFTDTVYTHPPSHSISEVTGLQSALDGKVNDSLVGVNNGIAELDSSGFVPASQLPSFVDDVLEFADIDSLPATGESGKIYITVDNNKTYRWSGSVYAEISASLALGETSTTAYRGDHGLDAYNHSQVTSGNPHGVTKADVGLSNVNNTSDAAKPISNATQTALNGKVDDSQVLTNVPAGAVFTDTVYTHPSLTARNVDTTGATIIDAVISNTEGHVTNVTTRTLTLADLGFTGDTDAINYVHPSHPGDDINIDTSVLSGATVISDLDFNVTTDAQGHVTDANASIATRELSKSDIGLSNVENTSDAAKPISTATQSALDGKVDDSQVLTNVPAGAVFTDTVYTHPTFTARNVNTSGATIIDTVSSNTDGHVTNVTSRTLTLGDLGFTGDTDANKYVHPTSAGNKHIPSGGSDGQILSWTSSGTAQWTNPSGGSALVANGGEVLQVNKSYYLDSVNNTNPIVYLPNSASVGDTIIVYGAASGEGYVYANESSDPPNLIRTFQGDFDSFILDFIGETTFVWIGSVWNTASTPLASGGGWDDDTTTLGGNHTATGKWTYSNGPILIGTGSDNGVDKLQVDGNIRSSGNIHGYIYFKTLSSSSNYTVVSDDVGSTLRYNTTNNRTITFNTNLGTGFNCMIINTSTGGITLAASGGTIDGKSSVTIDDPQRLTSVIRLPNGNFVTAGNVS